MKILWVGGFAVVASIVLAQTAIAGDSEERATPILRNCTMSFTADGKSIYLGIGYTEIHGSGVINCHNYLTGTSQSIPIKVTARGPGAGLGITGFSISGGAAGLGLIGGPESLYGKYLAVRGNAAVGIGVGGAVALKLSNGAATIDVSVQAQGGLGAGIDILSVRITPDTQEVAARESESVKPVPVKVIYVSENQPVHLVDKEGRLLEIIYLKRK